MTRASSTVLAVGAAGTFAGLVIPALAQRGVTVRGLIHNAQDNEDVRRRGADEVVIGDLHDQATIENALRGVDAVFYIAPAFIPKEAEIGAFMVEAAKRAGVRRFVFSSVIHPILSALGNHWAKVPVEEAILTSGMEYTLLHPALFYQNLAGSWPQVVQSGIFAEPWSTETRFSRVDYRDVAEVATIALTEDRLLFGTLELCTAGTLNRHDVASLMSEVLKRKIEPATPPRENVDGSSHASDDAATAGMRAMFAWYNAHNLLGNPLTLHAVLGREPRTLRAYLEELAHQPL